MLKYSNKKIIDVHDWNKLVKETYGRPYNFQQQDGCKERGLFHINIPSDEGEDEEMLNNSIPEKVNGKEMKVKFNVWLARDPEQLGGELEDDFDLSLFWQRNFYPDIHSVANDLYKKRLIEEGEYIINIDW